MNTQPTVAQVVESAYGWANGDVAPGEFVDDELTGPAFGDGLFEFLWRELVRGAYELQPNDADHWATAQARCAQVLREVQSVADALEQYAPTQAVAHE